MWWQKRLPTWNRWDRLWFVFPCHVTSFCEYIVNILHMLICFYFTGMHVQLYYATLMCKCMSYTFSLQIIMLYILEARAPYDICDNGQPVLARAWCDQKKDCDDLSDETRCSKWCSFWKKGFKDCKSETIRPISEYE